MASRKLSSVPARAAQPGYSMHRLLEARSLAVHALIAHKIERDPTLLDAPRNNLKRWSARWDGEVPGWYAQWCEIMQRQQFRQLAQRTLIRLRAGAIETALPTIELLTERLPGTRECYLESIV